MSIDETVSFSLEINVEKAYEDLRRYQTLLYRGLGLVRRLTGGDENLEHAISLMQRAIAITNQLRLAMIALHAASGPVGWALALVGLGTAALNLNDFMYDVSELA